MAQAVEELSIPRLKTTKPMPLYKGTLTLGNPEDYESALAIDVERYARVMQAKPPTASSFVVKSDLVPGDSSTQSSTTLMNGDSENKDGLSAVKSTRTYQVKDGNAPGGKRDVDREELARGYAYGAHAVPLGESEQNVTQFETTQSFTIMGFIPANEYRRFMDMTRSHLIVAQRTNEKAKLALSSFVNALYEAESFAVARFVQKDWKQPVLLILAPAIEPDYEGLIDIEIPFAEDVRPYRFPALDRITTVSGKVLTQHRNLPDEKLMRAMSQYVDHMDLSTFGRDDEGNPTEYLSMDDTYSPVLHRLNQAIRWRAVRPTEDVPRPSEVLTQPSNPPQELIESSKPYLEALQAAGDVKKVPPKQLSRKRGREYAKPLSGLDVDELLNRDKRRKISPDNAVPEYKQMLETSEDPGIIGEATKQMSKIVQDLVRHSVGDSGYGRAMECTRVMREELIEFEEPGLFNDFVKELKKKLLAGELGGDRMEMWWLLRVNRLGLIDKKASPSSSVTEEEARSFLSAK
ncbi:MAG: ATP-dependent DNA helicase II subunit 2 [Bogoriella megaspora]|nr:MAG: ATP-dependent DNA helicase II subunit 2 [Bogoriella megaspora]